MSHHKKGFFVILILLLSLIFSFRPVNVNCIGQTWLSNWNYCLPFTINSSLIDEELTNFPVYISLENSNVFGVIGDNYYKMAVADENGSQAYVEVAYWSSVENKAELWTSLNISNIVDQTFYYYFDNNQLPNTNYVGVSNSVVGASVWNNSFVLIDHMSDYGDSTHTIDSTSYSNDGVKKGNNEPTQQNEIIGYGQDFGYDTSIDDYININLSDELKCESNKITLSAWIKFDVVTGYIYFFNSNKYYLWVYNNQKISAFFRGISGNSAPITSSTITTGIWYQVTAKYESGVGSELYINGSSVDTDSDVGDWAAWAWGTYLTVGKDNGANQYYLNGQVDETRVYNNTLTNACIKANYYNEANLLLTEEALETYVSPTATPSEYTNDEILGVCIALIITFFSVALTITSVRRKGKN